MGWHGRRSPAQPGRRAGGRAGARPLLFVHALCTRVWSLPCARARVRPSARQWQQCMRDRDALAQRQQTRSRRSARRRSTCSRWCWTPAWRPAWSTSCVARPSPTCPSGGAPHLHLPGMCCAGMPLYCSLGSVQGGPCPRSSAYQPEAVRRIPSAQPDKILLLPGQELAAACCCTRCCRAAHTPSSTRCIVGQLEAHCSQA